MLFINPPYKLSLSYHTKTLLMKEKDKNFARQPILPQIFDVISSSLINKAWRKTHNVSFAFAT